MNRGGTGEESVVFAFGTPSSFKESCCSQYLQKFMCDSRCESPEKGPIHV